MKSRRKTALLVGTAFVLQGLLGALPRQATAEEDLAAFAYWKLPLGYSGSTASEPVFGFSLAQIHDGWLMAPSVYGVDRVQLPALVDLRFGGDEDPLPSLSFTGVDVGMVIDNALFQNAPGPAPGIGEWILIGAGVAMGGLGVCAAAGCFDDSEGGGGGEAVENGG